MRAWAVWIAWMSAGCAVSAGLEDPPAADVGAAPPVVEAGQPEASPPRSIGDDGGAPPPKEAAAPPDAGGAPDASAPDPAEDAEASAPPVEAAVEGGCATGSVYFSESFGGNVSGWTLGPEWQIGAAKPSACDENSADDPGSDHSSGATDAVAGVVIGGCAQAVVHGAHWLESPSIDLSKAPGKVSLSFWRKLSSDEPPYMVSRVELWTGSAWVPLWVSSQFVTDSTWTHVSYDVSAYKSSAVKLRFGFSVGDEGVYAMSSWSLDDVTLADPSCP